MLALPFDQQQLEKLTYVKPNELFKTLYYYYLNPKDLLMIKRFNRKALIILIDEIILVYKKAIESQYFDRLLVY